VGGDVLRTGDGGVRQGEAGEILAKRFCASGDCDRRREQDRDGEARDQAANHDRAPSMLLRAWWLSRTGCASRCGWREKLGARTRKKSIAAAGSRGASSDHHRPGVRALSAMNV